MRIHFSVVALLLLCAGVGAAGQSPKTAAPTCADLHLVPAVRECSQVTWLPGGDQDLTGFGQPQFAIKNPEVKFIRDDYYESLKDRVRFHLDATHVLFLFASDKVAIETLALHHLKFDAVMHDEGYVIALTSQNWIAVIAETSAGLFYGAQTLKQLLRGEEPFPQLYVPTIRDWPAMAHRGLSDDWSRGPLPNMDFLKREIRTLAAYKYNIFSPYFEHTYAYASSPVAAYPGGAMTPDEAREMVEYAAKYHITIIPEQESFGHLHNVLKFEQFSPLGETTHGSVLAPGDAGSLPLIGGWFAELAKVFPGPWAHVGADETFELGLGKTREAVEQQGLGKIYIDFLTKIHSTLEPNHKQLLFWGDIALKSPELVSTLPKDMIAVPWIYDARPDFTPAILPFTKAGLETWVAPGVSNWNRLYPNNNEALGNIRGFVRDGQKLGSTGELNTVWNDDGEGIFDENWFGVLFGAAAGWQAGESSEDAFTDSYGLAFHRDQTGKISQAQRELMAAHAVLTRAGLGDANDSYFWVDPFSSEGQRLAVKLRPAASELRLHAERAITLLAEARAAGKLDNPEALDALELGARRIDFVGLKVQAADESVALYEQAQALAGDKNRQSEVDRIVWSIGLDNGRFLDLRDGYALTRELYQQAWLRDNRPYWLENNLARYDQSTKLWIARSDRWRTQVMEQWGDTHTLPSLAEAGLPEAAAK
ncbi:MAG: family 20 glycosylhydrolase [Terracidiphilus sp.]|jgi:hypothetical protein